MLLQAQTHLSNIANLAFSPTGIQHRTHSSLHFDILPRHAPRVTFRYRSEQRGLTYRYTSSLQPATRYISQPTSDSIDAFTADISQRQQRTLEPPPDYVASRIQALALGLSTAPNDTRILTYANIPLTAGSIRALNHISLHSPDAYLGTDVMDLCITLLSEETQRLRRSHPLHYPGIRIFPTTFDTLVNTEPYSHAHIGRWTRSEDVFANDVLIWVWKPLGLRMGLPSYEVDGSF